MAVLGVLLMVISMLLICVATGGPSAMAWTAGLSLLFCLFNWIMGGLMIQRSVQLATEVVPTPGEAQNKVIDQFRGGGWIFVVAGFANFALGILALVRCFFGHRLDASNAYGDGNRDVSNMNLEKLKSERAEYDRKRRADARAASQVDRNMQAKYGAYMHGAQSSRFQTGTAEVGGVGSEPTSGRPQYSQYAPEPTSTRPAVTGVAGTTGGAYGGFIPGRQQTGTAEGGPRNGPGYYSGGSSRYHEGGPGRGFGNAEAPRPPARTAEGVATGGGYGEEYGDTFA